MDTAEDLRREVWRLLRETRGFVDPDVKRELAERAFMLAQRAEIIEQAARLPQPERHHDGDASRRHFEAR